MNYDAVVWDFDGVILDTEGAEYAAWNHVYQMHGVVLDLQTWGACIGRMYGYFDAYGHLEELIGQKVDRKKLDETRVPLFRKMVAELGPMDGVLDRLEDCKSLGLKLAIASSSDHPWIEGHLDRLGLRDWFPVIMAKEDTKQSKPNPEVYLNAAAAIDVPPERCIVFEDSPNGAKAAVAAGMKTFAVPHPVTAVLEFPEGATRVRGLNDIDLRGWVQG